MYITQSDLEIIWLYAYYIYFFILSLRVEFFWCDFRKETPLKHTFSTLFFFLDRLAHHQNVLVLAAPAQVEKKWQHVDRLQESSTRLSSEKKVHIMRIRRIWEVLNLIFKKQNNHCVSSPNKRSSISLKTNHFPLYSKSAAASVDRGWRSTYVCTMLAMVFCTKCLPCYHALQM